jgi:hypothetical protein
MLRSVSYLSQVGSKTRGARGGEEIHDKFGCEQSRLSTTRSKMRRRHTSYLRGGEDMTCSDTTVPLCLLFEPSRLRQTTTEVQEEEKHARHDSSAVFEQSRLRQRHASMMTERRSVEDNVLQEEEKREREKTRMIC